VLWIQEERHLRETPLHEHSKALPKIMWYADPAGRTAIEEFRVSGHTIRKGCNASVSLPAAPVFLAFLQRCNG
jgi:hypothetical protein